MPTVEERKKQTITPEKRAKIIEKYFGFYLNQVTDEKLNKLTRQALEDAPLYFWVVVNWTERCPEDEQVRSMVRRTAKTVYYARSLSECWQLEDYKEEITCAAILNDIYKMEFKWGAHGPESADRLRKLWGIKSPIVGSRIEVLLEIIRLHDGRAWSGLDILTPIWQTVSKPRMCAWLLHTAVYTASRRKTSFDWN